MFSTKRQELSLNWYMGHFSKKLGVKSLLMTSRLYLDFVPYSTRNLWWERKIEIFAYYRIYKNPTFCGVYLFSSSSKIKRGYFHKMTPLEIKLWLQIGRTLVAGATIATLITPKCLFECTWNCSHLLLQLLLLLPPPSVTGQ